MSNQSARSSDLHGRTSVSKSHQSWGEILGSHRQPATLVRSLGGTRELVTCIAKSSATSVVLDTPHQSEILWNMKRENIWEK